MSFSRHDPAGRVALLILICSAALALPLAWPVFQGRVFVYNDLTWFHLPLRYLYQQALVNGDSLLWTPSIYSGLYYHGEGQAGVFHPLHLLLYRLLSLRTAFDLELLASYVAAFAGMWWLLRRLRFADVPALFGAMLFAFSGFLLLHHHHVNMVAVVAHLPWLLAGADLLIGGDGRAARRLGFAVVALTIGSAFLVGFPQAVWWDGLTLLAFAAARTRETRRWRAFLPLTAAVAVGVAIGGIQILPSADAIATSDRAALGHDFVVTNSLHPLNLLQLWSPHALVGGSYTATDHPWFHEFGIYSGAILPVALAWVWLRRQALVERRGLIAWATICAGVALVLALGRYGGVTQWLAYLPVLGAMRAPTRYIVLVQFALALLAAVAIEDLLAIRDGRTEPPARPPLLVWIPTVLGVITTVALNGQLVRYARHEMAPVREAAPGVAILAVVTLLVVLAGRRVRWALPALIVMVAADLGVYGIGFVYREPPQTIPRLMVAVQAATGPPENTYAVAPDTGPFVKNLLVVKGYRLTSGYTGFFPAVRHPIGGERSLQLSGTRWWFTPEGLRREWLGGVARVRLIDEGGAPAAGRVQLTGDRPGHLSAAVRADAPVILAFTERFHPGWSATANGRPLPLVRVEHDFLGCRVEAGATEVDLRFEPRSFRNGAIVSAVGALMLAGVVVAWRPDSGYGRSTGGPTQRPSTT